MAYGMLRAKPITKFGEWLNCQMESHDMGVVDVAEKLHCSHATIIHHRTGKRHPTFSDVVAYCWMFDCIHCVEEIWGMIDILI